MDQPGRGLGITRSGTGDARLLREAADRLEALARGTPQKHALGPYWG